VQACGDSRESGCTVLARRRDARRLSCTEQSCVTSGSSVAESRPRNLDRGRARLQIGCACWWWMAKHALRMCRGVRRRRGEREYDTIGGKAEVVKGKDAGGEREGERQEPASEQAEVEGLQRAADDGEGIGRGWMDPRSSSRLRSDRFALPRAYASRARERERDRGACADWRPNPVGRGRQAGRQAARPGRRVKGRSPSNSKAQSQICADCQLPDESQQRAATLGRAAGEWTRHGRTTACNERRPAPTQAHRQPVQ
jgi:hypothetical protein